MKKLSFILIVFLSLLFFACSGQIKESGSIVISLPYGSARAADGVSYSYNFDFLFADSTTLTKTAESGVDLVIDDVPLGQGSVSVKIYDFEKKNLLYTGAENFTVLAGKTTPVIIKPKKAEYNNLKWKIEEYISFNAPDWSKLLVQRYHDEEKLDSEFVKSDEIFDIAYSETLKEDVNYAGNIPVVLTSKDKAFIAPITIPMCLSLSEVTKNCLSVKPEQEKNSYTVTNKEVKIIFIDAEKAEHEFTISFDATYEWYINDEKIEGENTSTYTLSPRNTATAQCKAILTPKISDEVKALLGELKLFDEETVTLASEKMTFTPYKGEVDDYGDDTRGYYFEVEYPISEYEQQFSFYGFDLCNYYRLTLSQNKNEGGEVSSIKDVVFYFDGEKIIPDGEPNIDESEYSINYVYNFNKYMLNFEYLKEYMSSLSNDEQEKFQKMVELINQYGRHEIICYITLEDGSKTILNSYSTK